MVTAKPTGLGGPLGSARGREGEGGRKEGLAGSVIRGLYVTTQSRGSMSIRQRCGATYLAEEVGHACARHAIDKQ